MSDKLKMPDAEKLADLLLSQGWVEFDSSTEYWEFISALGCNLYDPSVQPAPGGEDVVLSAARTAPAEPALSLDKYMDMMYDRDSHAKKVDSLQAEVDRLKAELKDTREAYLNQSARVVLLDQEMVKGPTPEAYDAVCKALWKHRDENERLQEQVERLQSENQSLLMQCTGMGNSIDELKRSLQNEVNRRNQYAMESNELDRQVEALKADAERYRWLCDGNGYFLEEQKLCGHFNEKEKADTEIDAARTAKPEVKS